MRSSSQSKALDSIQWTIVTVTAMILATSGWHEHDSVNRGWSLFAAVALVLGYSVVRRREIRTSFLFFQWFVTLFVAGQLATYACSRALRGALNAHAGLTIGVGLFCVVATWLVLRSVGRAVFRRGDAGFVT